MFNKENTLHGIFINKLNALLDIETELTKALPKMADSATDPDLKAAFELHLHETASQRERLKAYLESMEEKPVHLKGDAIRGLIKDGEWVIKNVEKGPAQDANLIGAAQAVEHYEMALYGTALAWAKSMGHSDAESLLEQSLQEEKAADQKLNELALNKINSQVETGM